MTAAALRAKVEGLREGIYPEGDNVPEFRAAVLALIPEDAVLVTEERLARAWRRHQDQTDHAGCAVHCAAAILARLRETE